MDRVYKYNYRKVLLFIDTEGGGSPETVDMFSLKIIQMLLLVLSFILTCLKIISMPVIQYAIITGCISLTQH